MEDKKTDREHKIKLKKKRKLEDEKELLDYDDVKKKKEKKRKKTDEEKEEEEEKEENTHIKRRRKESESDSDWFVRHKSNTELIKVRALNKKEITEQEKELVTQQKKKKKKKMKYEKRVEDNEYFPVKKKKKKKKRKETEQETNTSSTTFIAEKKNLDRREEEEEEGKREENIHSPIEHIFQKPFPVQEKRRGGGGGGQTWTENESRREASYNRDQRMKEGRDKTNSEEEEGGRGGGGGRDETDSDTNQKINQGGEEEGINTKNIDEKEDRMKGLKGVVSRLAYNGMLGWETDTSVDDLDYSDEDYHLSSTILKQRLSMVKRNRLECVIYSEGENIEGFVPDPRYSSDNESNDWTTVEVTPVQRLSPGYEFQQRQIETLEEAMYKFPPGVGVAPEDVEEVQDAENYWIMKDKVLDPSSFAEEAKEYIDGKLKYIEDYFERLEAGCLTAAELKERVPENFDDPYYPTPYQLKFLNTLNIKVNWPLSDLHKYAITTYNTNYRQKYQWHQLGLFADTSRLTLRESKIIIRNWFAFQKEYGFYDLRPLVSVRTARVMREDGKMMVQPYKYLSPHNRVHFLLYLAKDLPYRAIAQIERKMHNLLPFVQGQCLMRKSLCVSGLLLAKLQYVLEMFGADMVAAELLVGQAVVPWFYCCFSTYIMMRNLKLRIGPWRKDEDERFLQGLQEVMRVKTFEDAYRLRKVPWMSIFPYVRTRKPAYMRRRLNILAGRNDEKDNLHLRRICIIKLIRTVYNQGVDDFTYLDWEGLARETGSDHPIRLVWWFRQLYFQKVPYTHRITVPEGIRYMYEHLLPFYERISRRRTLHHSDPDHQPQEDPQDDPDPSRDPSGDPSGDLDLPTDPSNASVNAISSHSDLSDPKTSIVTSSSTHDLTKPRKISATHQHDPKSSRKVTREQNDLKKSRKVKYSNPDDLTNPKKVTCDDLHDQHHLEDDLEDDLVNFDLSDSEDDLTSENDFYDLENVTLGQLLGRTIRD